MWKDRRRRVAIEFVFWGTFFIGVLPYLALFLNEASLKGKLEPLATSSNWTMVTHGSGKPAESVRIPLDLRGGELGDLPRHWTFSKQISHQELLKFDDPTIVLGRIGDSDRVRLNDCELGSHGLSDGNQQDGWWWGVLREYQVPKSCLRDQPSESSTLEVNIYAWSVANHGIFAGPVGVGSYASIHKLVEINDWLRFRVLSIYGILLLAVGLYYLFVFLLVPARSYNGVFALFALSTGFYEVMVSGLPYRFISDTALSMRLNFVGAGAVAMTFIWFLSTRLQAVSHKLVWITVLGTLVFWGLGLPQSTLAGVSQFYQLWFPFFLLMFLVGYVQLIRRWWTHSHDDSWRYLLGCSIFIGTCVHDVLATSVLSNRPYLVPYGFLILLVAAAFALAKEYADAFLHVEATVEDRTKDLQEANRQLKALEAMKARFFANISHDFKTPLAIAFANVEEAKRSAGHLAKRAFLSTENALNKLSNMVRDLLDTVKAESGELKMIWEVASVARLVQEWTKPYEVLCCNKNLELKVEIEPTDKLRIPMDVAKIERVFANLVSNSLKFTTEGSISVHVKTDPSHLYVEIEDTGPGIAPEEREKIFDRYYQGFNTTLREHGGSGIGLSFVKEMVDLHNGRVWVEEGEAGGSKFIISLPLSQDVDIAGEYELPETAIRTEPLKGSLDVPYPPSQPEEILSDRPSILMAEDNPEVAQVIWDVLREHYNVYFARHGQEALGILGEVSVQCVISDVMMPEMMGTELLKEIRKIPRLQSVPVIMLTSKAETDDILEHLALGAQDYVSKPFHREILLARVRAQVEAHQLRDKLVASEKMVTLGLLTAGISHEIRNPILAAGSNLGGLKKILSRIDELGSADGNLSEKAKKVLIDRADRIHRAFNSAENAIHRIQTIVDSMKGYTSGSADRTEINIYEALSAALAILESKRKEKSVVVAVDGERTTKILGYASLNQVFLNLLDNALDAVESEVGKVSVKISAREGQIVIDIVDNGTGIPPEMVERIFDPFMTTKPPGDGTGLGLYISKDIVEMQHGGRLSVTSKVGEGTRFRMELPLQAPKHLHDTSVPFHGKEMTVV